MKKEACPLASIKHHVTKITADYVEPMEGARERLNNALEVIVVTYYASLIKQHATKLLDDLGA